MVTEGSHTYIPLAVPSFTPNSETLFSSVVKYILNKVECTPRFEPFIIEVFHLWARLKNNIFTPKNRRIERHIPKESGLRRRFSQRGIN